MESINKTEDSFIPPSSVTNDTIKIFSERYVRMYGHDYYLRVFSDGTSEFTRFDRETAKWVFLVFLAA